MPPSAFETEGDSAGMVAFGRQLDARFHQEGFSTSSTEGSFTSSCSSAQDFLPLRKGSHSATLPARVGGADSRVGPPNRVAGNWSLHRAGFGSMYLMWLGRTLFQAGADDVANILGSNPPEKGAPEVRVQKVGPPGFA